MSIDRTTWCGYGYRILGLGTYANAESGDAIGDISLDGMPFDCTAYTASNAYTGESGGDFLIYRPSIVVVSEADAIRLPELVVDYVDEKLKRCAAKLGLVIEDPGWWMGSEVS